VDFFEKIETLEKRQAGTISKVFSTHPPDRTTASRRLSIISRVSEGPSRSTWSNTSEFDNVKGAGYGHGETGTRSVNKEP